MKECETEITEQLRAGPVEARKVIDRVKRSGHSEGRIGRARTKLVKNRVIIIEKAGFQAVSTWRLL
jgi:hypothetical protein